MIRIFAYGTLRPGLYEGVERRFNVKKVGDATLRGPFQLLHLGGFPGLTKDFDFPITTITGEVIETENLDRLDGYEGYRPDGKGLYDRKEVVAKLSNGETVQCWVYLFVTPKDDGQGGSVKFRVIQSGDWAKR